MFTLKLGFVQTVEPRYRALCSGPVTDTSTQDEKNKLHGLKCSC